MKNIQDSTANIGEQNNLSPSGDILEGAEAIAEFLFGSKDKARKVYHLVERRRLPVFRPCGTICARRSTLLAWIDEQERRSIGEDVS